MTIEKLDESMKVPSALSFRTDNTWQSGCQGFYRKRKLQETEGRNGACLEFGTR